MLLHGDAVGVSPLAWRLLDRPAPSDSSQPTFDLHLARYPSVLASMAPAAPVNDAVLGLLARGQYPADDGTAFEGVFRMPASTEMHLSSFGVAGPPDRWWTLPPEPGVRVDVPLWDALVTQCEALMRPSGDCAVFLSGGIDSSTVAAAASAAARRNGWRAPLLLSVVYPGLACDESVWQRAVAKHLEVPLLSVDATALEMWPAAQATLRRGTPLADTQAAATSALLHTALDRGCSTILSGMGADVLFMGDGAELELLRRGRLFAVDRFFRGIARARPQSLAMLWYRRGWKSLIRPDGFGTPEEIAAAGSASRAWLRRSLSHPVTGWRVEMIEQGIERPVTLGLPFYGRGFLDAFSKVRDIDLAGGVFKGLLRETVRPYLPAFVVDRQLKANFLDFHRVWMRRERETLLQRYGELLPKAPHEWAFPRSIEPLLQSKDPTHGLIAAWLLLGVLEFREAWNLVQPQGRGVSA